MKHNIKITLILLAMFLVTQLIGLAVINAYSPKQSQALVNGTLTNITIKPQLPYGMQPPEVKPEVSIVSIITAMIIAVLLIFLLMRIKATLFLKFWFFFVVMIALSITFNSVLMKFSFPYMSYLAIAIALPLTFYKIFKRNLLVHNFTELLIYPGVAAVFVPILSIWTMVLLLFLISAYDIYAVWHSGFMQKMAKFQINQLGIFTGFFIPYADKKTKLLIQRLKEKYKKMKIPSKAIKQKKIAVNLAILGGGDVVFPILMAGVVLVRWGLWPALIITLGASISLLYLFMAAKKRKFYPAMPFLTAGCLIGLAFAYLIHLLM